MLQQPARPSGNVQLPYTTADMAERLAKKKAAKDRQDIIDSLQGGLSYGKGGVDLGSVAKSVGGFLKTAYENMPESIDTPVSSYGTGKSLITEPARLAVRRAVGDITAIPKVGEPSPSYSADKIRQQGVALGLLGAAIDYSQFIPVVAKGAGVASDAINASRIARMNRSPFPKIETPGAFLDVDALQGSRLPARVVDTPATPATRLAEAQTQRALPPAATPEMTAQLQRQTARTELGVNIQDIEFPPKGSMTTASKAVEDVAAAEMYANKISALDGNVSHWWSLKDKLQWPEFKKPYYEYIENVRAAETALDSYDHIHPEAWIEIGDIQSKSGFNPDRMSKEMASIRQYFSNTYGKIQEYLSVLSHDPLLRNYNFSQATQQYSIAQGRDKYFKEMNDLVADIDRAFQVVPPVTRPFTVYRGVSISNIADPYAIAFYKSLKAGDLMFDPAFSSTSIDRTLAERWAGRPDDIVLIIQVPKGTSVIHPISSWEKGKQELQYHDNAPSEKELLLNKNSTFKVLRNDGKFIEVELVPSDTSTTNVRTIDKTFANKISFEDALATVQDETVRRMILKTPEETWS